MLIYTGKLDPKLGLTVASQPAVLIVLTDISLSAPVVFYYQSLVLPRPLAPIVKTLGFIDQVTARTEGPPSFTFSGSSSPWRFEIAPSPDTSNVLTADGPNTDDIFPAGLNKFGTTVAVRAFRRAAIPPVPRAFRRAAIPPVPRPNLFIADDTATTVSDDPVMTISIGQQSPVTGMAFKCAFTSPTSPFSPYPCIYVGTLTWADRVVASAMIVVVIPSSLDVGQSVCAYWQWSSSYFSDECATFEGSFTSVLGSQTHLGSDVIFSDSIYTFQGWINEIDSTMTLTVSDASSNSCSAQFRLKRSSLLDSTSTPPSSPGPGSPLSRQKRARSLALVTTWAVTNDYHQDIVFCIFTSSPVSLFSQIVGAIGLGLGGVGLTTAFTGAAAASGSALATLMGPATAIPLAIVSAIVSITSFVDVMVPADTTRHVTLFPGEQVIQKSSGGIISANSGIFLRFSLADSIEDGVTNSTFTVTMLTRSNGPAIATYPLSQLFSQFETEITEIVSLPLSLHPPPTKRLKLQYFRLVSVRGLGMNMQPKNVTTGLSINDLATGIFHANEFPVNKGMMGLQQYDRYPYMLWVGKDLHDRVHSVFAYVPGTQPSSTSPTCVLRSKLGIFFVRMVIKDYGLLTKTTFVTALSGVDILDVLDNLLTTQLSYNACWAFAPIFTPVGWEIWGLDLSPRATRLYVPLPGEPVRLLYIRTHGAPQVLSQWVEVDA